MAVSTERKKELNRINYLRKKEEKKLTNGFELSAKMVGERMKKDHEWALNLDASGERAPGEFHSYETLYGIFYGSKGIVPAKHSVAGQPLDFTLWLEFRMRCRRDLWFLAERLGYLGLSDKPHRMVVDFFVKKDNTSLEFEYTIEQLKQCLLTQDEKHYRLLLFPRGFYKSSLMLADAAQWVINFPDISILSVSSTKILSGNFSREFRNYFIIKDQDDPTRMSRSGEFKILYPDFCLLEGKGKSDSYQCPIARLDQKEHTFSRTSVEAATAGSRAHLILFDDIQSERNYRKISARVEVRETYDAIRELAVPPFSFIQVAGTRWTNGKVGDDIIDGRLVTIPDVYGTILERIDRNEDKNWKVLVAAAWTPKESAQGKKFSEYEPEDVDLLWGEQQGSFDVLKAKAVTNEELFRCNQLNEPAGQLDDDDTYFNTMTVENIRKEMRTPGFLESIQGRIYLFGDTAMTSGKKSDYSAFAIAKIELRENLDPMVWWAEIKAGHWTDKQTASVIAELMLKWSPDQTLVEEIPSMSNWFKDEVRRQISMRNCQHLSFRWFQPDDRSGAKESRIRGLQLLHERGLMKFIIGSWTELMIKQLTEYNGDKKLHKNSKGGRKDDIPDAMSFIFLPGILPYVDGVSKPEDELVIKTRAERMAVRAQYDRIFGTNPTIRPQPTAADLNDNQLRDPIHDALAPLFGNRMPRQAFPRQNKESI